MGRHVKLSDREKEWFRPHHRSQERFMDTREERKRFLIVCEGAKTEPHYFEAFNKILQQHVVQLDIHGEGANTLSLVARAQHIRDSRLSGDYPFDQVWVVFDRDSVESDDFDNAIHKAKSAGMHCAWSNEAFEIWYILHFEYRNTGMSRTEYQSALSDLLGEPYQKNAPDMYLKLLRYGKQAQAVTWARKLHDEFLTFGTPPSQSNPCTTVFLLVEELNRFKVNRGEGSE